MTHSPESPAFWDELYTDAPQVWSGAPNGTLVTEVADLPPGQALDVGCGEGADAHWLAARGWTVTGLDVSRVALDRAAASGAGVRWVHAGLLDGAGTGVLAPGGFDLVSAQYPALHRTPGQDAERALLGLVAPGGTLLVVHHDTTDHDTTDHGTDHDSDHDSGHDLDDQPDHAAGASHRAAGRAFDPAEWVLPAQVRALLEDGWVVEVDTARPRHVPTGAGAGHTTDLVLRARRLG